MISVLQRGGLHSALMVLFSALILLRLSGSISRNQKTFSYKIYSLKIDIEKRVVNSCRLY